MNNSTPNNPETQIVPFTYEGNEIRTIRDNDEVWVVARDIVECVGAYWNGSASIKHVPEQWKGVRSDVTPGGTQQVTVLSEQGAYFYLARSDKPAALPFQMWLAGEVLPSIRKTGQYSVQQLDPVLALMEGVKQTRLAQLELEKQVSEHDNRLMALEAEQSYFTIMGYFRMRGKVAPEMGVLQGYGKRAKSLSIEMGYTISEVKDTRYGKVGGYHEDVLKALLGF